MLPVRLVIEFSAANFVAFVNSGGLEAGGRSTDDHPHPVAVALIGRILSGWKVKALFMAQEGHVLFILAIDWLVRRPQINGKTSSSFKFDVESVQLVLMGSLLCQFLCKLMIFTVKAFGCT